MVCPLQKAIPHTNRDGMSGYNFPYNEPPHCHAWQPFYHLDIRDDSSPSQLFLHSVQDGLRLTGQSMLEGNMLANITGTRDFVLQQK